mgnify:CR=1 FL=1
MRHGGNLSQVRDDKAKSQLIHYAAAYDRFNFIEYLVQHNVDINVKNNEGSTPLHIAGTYSANNKGNDFLRKKIRSSLGAFEYSTMDHSLCRMQYRSRGR